MIKIRKNLGSRIFDTLNTVMLVFLMVLCVYPMIHVLFASVSELQKLSVHDGLMLYPLGFSLESYKKVFEKSFIFTGYYNSILYVGIGTALSLFLTSLGAYGLSRKNVLLAKPIMIMVVFTMFFSGGLIPTYLLVKDLGMVNHRIAVILPTAISTWNLIIMRTNFMGIPESLEESARLDGANDFFIFAKVIIPLSKPIIAVMLLFYGVGRWNDWFQAMIYLRDRDLYPLQLFLREILIQNQLEEMRFDEFDIDSLMLAETIKYSIIVIATLPIIFMYPMLQKHFVKGIMIGALKG